MMNKTTLVEQEAATSRIPLCTYLGGSDLIHTVPRLCELFPVVKSSAKQLLLGIFLSSYYHTLLALRKLLQACHLTLAECIIQPNSPSRKFLISQMSPHTSAVNQNRGRAEPNGLLAVTPNLLPLPNLQVITHRRQRPSTATKPSRRSCTAFSGA